MAGAFRKPGCSFHGVLHKMTHEHMLILDKIEAVYVREVGNVRLYDGSLVEATVYVFQESFLRDMEVKKIKNNHPSER
jgi:hypothetical protein